jgi:hypothetical protein
MMNVRIAIVAAVLLIPVSSFAQSSEPPQAPIHLLVGAGLVLHAADLSVTSWMLGKEDGRFYEANPLMRPFADDPIKLAVAKMTIAVAVNYGILRLYQRNPKTAIVVGILQTIGIGYVAHRNAQLLRADQGR